MTNWKMPHWLMAAGAVFGGAVLSYVKTSLITGDPPATPKEWEALLVTAIGTGIAAVCALYITPPVKPPPPGGTGDNAPSLPPNVVKKETSLRPPSGVSRTCGVFALVVGVAACSPAAFATLTKVEQLVLDDLAAGKTPEQVEADVATLLCGSNVAPLCVDAVIVVNDVVSVLIDTGVLAKNPVALAGAQRLQAAEHAKIAARMGGK